jgi:hypothetical protein
MKRSDLSEKTSLRIGNDLVERMEVLTSVINGTSDIDELHRISIFHTKQLTRNTYTLIEGAGALLYHLLDGTQRGHDVRAELNVGARDNGGVVAELRTIILCVLDGLLNEGSVVLAKSNSSDALAVG